MKQRSQKLSKGYIHDAGVDVATDTTVVFYPHCMKVIDLKVTFVPKKNTMIVVAPRSSYAAKGLIICNCPVDPDYDGNIHAIVFNGSGDMIICPEGESFCQLMNIRIKSIKNVRIKKKGKRGNHSFGSTDA